MKKISKIVTGIAMCGLVFATSTFSFAEKTAYPADFSLKLNGRDVKLENADILSIDGSTYLPLAALCKQLLGMNVDWNADTRTVEMWSITKPTDRGSHEFPVPIGVAVTGEFYNKTDKQYIPYNVSVTEVIRGSSVDQWLRKEYMSIVGNEYPVKESVVKKDGEKKDAFEKRQKAASDKYDKAVKAWEDKFEKYMDTLRGDTTKEFLRAKVRIDIVQSNSEFEYKTAANEFVPYSGNATVDGLLRQYVEYKVGTPKIRNEVAYAGKVLLTNGSYEGYYVVPVYKTDAQPRMIYKDGQCLALYN